MNQRKEEDERRNYFMINLHVSASAVSHASEVRHFTNCATRPSYMLLGIGGLVMLFRALYVFLW